jgi:hypothetical protein
MMSDGSPIGTRRFHSQLTGLTRFQSMPRVRSIGTSTPQSRQRPSSVSSG